MVSFLFPAFAALAIVKSTLAQQPVTLIASSLPACAQQCAVLLQAQQACVPPPNGAAVVSNQGTYNSCFCQSAYLTPLNGPTPQGVCPACTAADTTTLQTWFTGFCASGGAVAGANGNPNGQPTTSTTSTTQANVPTATGTGGRAVGGVTQGSRAPGQNKSWIETHARWVVMLVVLTVGLAAFAFVLWYFHRRYQRKRELRDHSRAPGVQPDMNTWGPGQSVHDFHAPGQSAAGAAPAEKTQERAVAEEPGIKSKRNSKRLKKPWV